MVAHVAGGGLAEEEEALEVQVEDGVPGALFHVDSGREEVGTGVVDEDVEAAEFGNDFVDDGLDLIDAAELAQTAAR